MTNTEISPSTPRVDCTGLSLEAVLVRTREAVRETGGLDVVLENVAAAGPLVSSPDAWRIRAWAQYSRVDGVWVEALVGDAEPVADAVESVEVPGLTAGQVRSVLAAAAALELRRSPLSVFRAFAAALAGPLADDVLLEVVRRHPLLVADGEGVGFVGLAEHRAAREEFPLTREQQALLYRALREVAEPEYRFAAGPVHAALAGELEQELGDVSFLAGSGWYGLALGLRLAYRGGVPLGGLAGDLNWVLLQGVAEPGSHEEWLSWVHHSLVGRGMTEAADELAARVRLPWRTVWSQWRWPAAVEPERDEPVIGGGELVLVRADGESAVAGRWEPNDDPDEVVERVWDMWTGTLLADVGPARHEVVPFDTATGLGLQARHDDKGHWRDMNSPILGRRPEMRELPWAAPVVKHAVRCTPVGPDGALWVYSGYGGGYAAVVDEAAVLALPDLPRGPMVPPVPDGRWQPPARVPLTGEVGREFLEAEWAFGPGSCRTVVAEQLPEGAARRFLAEVGWPACGKVADFEPADLSVGGLRPADRPGLFEGLGEVGGRWTLLLDGASGRVLVRFKSADEPELAASSPAQFLALVLLLDAVLSVDVLFDEAHAGTLEDDAMEWVRQVDPAAAGTEFWQDRFSGLYEKWCEYPDTLL